MIRKNGEKFNAARARGEGEPVSELHCAYFFQAPAPPPPLTLSLPLPCTREDGRKTRCPRAWWETGAAARGRLFPRPRRLKRARRHAIITLPLTSVALYFLPFLKRAFSVSLPPSARSAALPRSAVSTSCSRARNSTACGKWVVYRSLWRPTTVSSHFCLSWIRTATFLLIMPFRAIMTRKIVFIHKRARYRGNVLRNTTIRAVL